MAVLHAYINRVPRRNWPASAADRVVDFAAAKGCNGNLTVLRHGGGYQTYYLHQVRWMPDITVGTPVKQGL